MFSSGAGEALGAFAIRDQGETITTRRQAFRWGSKVDGPCVGIDLGTTQSCVAIFQDGKPMIVPNVNGGQSTPSVVAFTQFEWLVGETAKNQATSNPFNTLFDLKRLIGKKMDDSFIRSLLTSYAPFKVVPSEGQKPSIEVEFMGEVLTYSPEEISAMILADLKKSAEVFLGEQVKHAVVTVPANFNDAQRRATLSACQIAGFNVLRLLSDSTAAAVHFCHKEPEHCCDPKNIVVIDLGGGTLDVTLATVDEGIIEIIATAGDPTLGWEDFDTRVLTHCVQTYKRRLRAEPSATTILRLRAQCEQAKRVLSSASETTIVIASDDGREEFSLDLTRTVFEKLCSDLFRAVLDPVDKVLRDSGIRGISKGHVHDVVLVGNSTRIPKIQSLVRDYFDGKELYTRLNVEGSVAFGAAIQAAKLAGFDAELDKILLLEVAGYSLGVETDGGVMTTLIERNSTIPQKKASFFDPQ